MSGILQMVFAASVSSAAPINTVAPVVTGTAQVRQMLSCTTGTWTNVPPIIGYAYQWQYDNTNIPGATSSTYTIESAYVGTSIRCIVTASNSAGSRAASSNATTAVAANVPLAPTIGTATATSSTTATVAFTANDNGGASVTVFTATSNPGGITGTSASSPITVNGLTSLTSYNFTVTATNSAGTSAASGSSNTITPGAVAPVNTVSPTVFGAAVVRVTISSSTGTWTGAPSPTFTYQWQSQSTGDISGATSSDFVIPTSLLGQNLRCRVTGTNVAGSAQAFTPYTSSVQANTPEAPASVSASIDDPVNFPRRVTVTAAVPDNGGSAITAYNWFRSVNGGSFLSYTSTSGPTLVDNVSGTSPTTVAYKASAVNLIGNGDQSPASNTVSVP